MTADRRAEQRERLIHAEAETFAHYGIEATSQPLEVHDPPTTTRVVRTGEGPPVVLLHGGSMTSTVWAPLLPHVRGRSLWLVDLPGCGLADPIDLAGVDVAEHQATFVGSMLDALGLRRAALAGASLGGMYALRFAVTHPQRVRALSLISAPALALPGARMPFPMSLASNPVLGRLMLRAARPMSARSMRRMLEMIGGRREHPPVPDAMYEALAAAMFLAGPTTASMAADMLRGATPRPHVTVDLEQLGTCPVPVQFVWGRDDKVQGAAAAHRAAEVLPDARVDVLEGGHGIWFDQPEACGRLVSAFLAATDHETAA